MRRIEVKICGLTNRDDAVAALEAGADYLGFVLYEKSLRGITPGRMVSILEELDVPRKAVAVCVNMSRSDVEQVAGDAALHAVQLHGDEHSEEFSGMSVLVWRAIRLGEAGPNPDPVEWDVDRYVLDAAVKGLYGGTGELVDKAKAREVAKVYPVMLAGGLDPDNVALAVRKVHPLGVDTAGGVETLPGKKDHDKVRAFVQNARTGLEQ